MITIRPFKALRPRPEWALRVAAPPYDVMSREEAKNAAGDNPHSFLHVTRSEIDLPEVANPYDPKVYEKAKQNLQRMIADGTLIKEAQACLYIYELTMNERSMTGLACLSSIEDYQNGLINKHELTRPEKENDRILHITITRAQTGKVFLAYKSVQEVDAVIHDWKTRHEPLYHFTAADNVTHAVWKIDDERTIQHIITLFKEKVPATYIADGHHRAASATQVSNVLPDNESARFFLTVIFPDNHLHIMDYNRAVTDLNGLTPTELLTRIREDFEVSESTEAVSPTRPHEIGMYLQKRWYRLSARPGTYAEDLIGQLDVSILSANILDKHLGLKDIRTDKRIDFIGGIRGLKELERLVNDGKMQVSFSLYPVTIQQLFNIADAGLIMPPKSTWFEPKLRDGLLTHLLE
jgi:Uncharacterized conserved protein